MAHILSMLSGREALWQQRRDRAHARQFLRVTHNFSTVNASGTPPGSPMNIFGVNRAPGGAGEEENEFLWNCDIPGSGKGLHINIHKAIQARYVATRVMIVKLLALSSHSTRLVD